MTTPAPEQVPIQPTSKALAWLRGRTFAELGAVEAQEICPECRGIKRAAPCAECEGTGRTTTRRKFFPGSMRWRDATGAIVEDKVLFVLPREEDFQRAQDMAIAWFAKHYSDSTIKTVEQAEQRATSARYAAKERAALVSLCARAPEPPHIQAFTMRTLLDRFDPHTLDLAVEEIKLLRELNEIPVADLTEVQFVTLAREVARVGNASPLLVLDDALRGPFVTTLARRYVASLTASSGSGLPEGSTQET